MKKSFLKKHKEATGGNGFCSANVCIISVFLFAAVLCAFQYSLIKSIRSEPPARPEKEVGGVLRGMQASSNLPLNDAHAQLSTTTNQIKHASTDASIEGHAVEEQSPEKHIHDDDDDPSQPISLIPMKAKQQLPQPKAKVAYAITVTKDGPYVDGAAVLAQSIYSSCPNTRYPYDLVAFVHPEVKTARPLLEFIGYRVLERAVPLNTSTIRGDYLRDTIEKQGCCGSSELIKLWSYTLTEYQWVMHLDMDSMLIQCHDELFDKQKPVDFMYTTDPGMAPRAKYFPVQGGFLLIRPNVHHFKQLVDIVREGDFRQGRGWEGKVGAFWGGKTIQGLMAYWAYFKSDNATATTAATATSTIGTAPSTSSTTHTSTHLTTGSSATGAAGGSLTTTFGSASLEVDKCVYNNMVDIPRCKQQDRMKVRSTHFTICQKPWLCLWHRKAGNELCEHFFFDWFLYRAQLERSMGLKVHPAPCSGKGKGQRYLPFDITHATKPSYSTGYSDWQSGAFDFDRDVTLPKRSRTVYEYPQKPK